MSLAKINILQVDGGLQQIPANEDGNSGLLVYTPTGGEAISSGLYNIYTPQQALQFTSNSSGLYYHIDEYFQNSEYPLTVGIYFYAPTNFAEINILQDFAEGSLRLIGIWNDWTKYSTISQIQNQIIAINTACVNAQTDNRPLDALYTAYSSTGLANLTTLRTLNSPNVSYGIHEDVNNPIVKALRIQRNKWVGGIGNWLGTMAKTLVQDCIGNNGKYNINTGSTWFASGFIDGSSEKTMSLTQKNALDDKGYIFTIKESGNAGTWYNNSWTCTAATSDYYTVERNRVWKKAFRNIYTVFLPEKNSTVDLDNGKLSLTTIAYLKGKGRQALEGMFINGEISNYDFDVPLTQTPLTNGGKVQVIGKIVPQGILKTLEVPLGYTAKI